MTAEKVKEATAVYRKHFEDWGIPKERNTNWECSSKNKAMAHLHYMLDEIDRFCDEGEMGKAFRWLGFAQGALASMGIFTIEELKNHNRP